MNPEARAMAHRVLSAPHMFPPSVRDDALEVLRPRVESPSRAVDLLSLAGLLACAVVVGWLVFNAVMEGAK